MFCHAIETLWQQMEWDRVQKSVSISLIIYVLYKFLIYTKAFSKRFSVSEKSSFPGFKSNATLFYISTLLSIYKQCSPNIPAMCLVSQKLFGLCQVYGKNGIFTLKLLFKPMVVFFKPETVEIVLSSAEHIEKSAEYSLLRPWVGTGLLTSASTKWRKHRKLVTPTFHFSILDNFIPVYQKQANVLISSIQSHIEKPWIDIVPLMSLSTLDVICETAMGVSMNFLKGENCDYSNAMEEIESAIMYRILRPWLYPDIIFHLTPLGKKFKANLQLVQGINEMVLKKKIESAKCNKESASENGIEKNSVEEKVRKPFLELLLEYHLKDPSFTEEDIKDHVATTMFGGHETTATLMSWVLYILGIYPEIQREVHKELDAIFDNEANENISRAVLAKMKYLECVFKETMRLYPVVPFIMRENKRSFKVLDHTVSKGSICIIFIGALHRDPVSFPDPEKFDPKRFLTENCANRHPYAFTPFSAGPRNCLGQKFAMMEAKTILALVLRRYRVIALDPRDKVLTYANLVIRNVHPLRLRFVPR